MRKLVVSNMITLDGFLAGPNGEIDWHTVGEDFNDFAAKQLDEMDAILFGRVTYELMASYWPTPEALDTDPIIAKAMNGISKIVFSQTLDKAIWENSRLVKGSTADEVAKLKAQSGKDMVIFGSGGLVSALTKAGLIDEYRLFIAPVVLGEGLPMFRGIKSPVNLKLIRTQTFENGLVLMVYEMVRE